MEASVEQRKTRAVAKWLRISPRKVRLVADLVRGRTVSEALAILKFTPNRGAALITKVVNSAAANAENVHGMDREVLRIHRIVIDQAGPTLKRYQPVSRGVPHAILKRLSHITVEVTEDEKLAAAKQAHEEARRQKRRGTGGRGRGKAAAAAAGGETAAPKRTRTKRAAAAAPVEEVEATETPEKPIEASPEEAVDEGQAPEKE